MPKLPLSRKLIDHNLYYTLYQISKEDLFETKAHSFDRIRAQSRRIIALDIMTNKHLKTKIVPDKNRENKFKYKIKGINILEWLINKEL